MWCLKLRATQRGLLMCDDVPVTASQDYFSFCCGRVFREVKLICPSNVINPPVNVSFDKGLLSISLLSFHSEKIFQSSNASTNLYPKVIQWQSWAQTKALYATGVDLDDSRSSYFYSLISLTKTKTPWHMIKGLVHLKILFSLCFSDFKALKHLTLFCLTKKGREKKRLLCGCSQQQTEWWKLAANMSTTNNTSSGFVRLRACSLCVLFSVFLSSCLSFFLFPFLSLLLGLCILWRWQHSESAWTFQPLLWSLLNSPRDAFPGICSKHTHTHAHSSMFNTCLSFLRKTKFHTGI